MKMKKLLSLFTFAFAAAVAPTAVEAAGDIIDIRVMDMPGKSFGERSLISGSVCSPDNPVVAGEEICIRVRMVVRNAELVKAGKGAVAPKTWGIFDGTEKAGVLDRPSLGLRIGEKNVWAEYSDTGSEAWQQSGVPLQYDDSGVYDETRYIYLTDLYFKYTVQPGDMGLPVKLLKKDLSVADDTASSANEYAFRNVNCVSHKFSISNSDSEEAELYRMDPIEYTGKDLEYPGTTYPLEDYNLAKERLYVKTVDFDSEMAIPDDAIWREVNQTGVKGSDAALVVSAGATVEAVTTVYLWSADETKVVPLVGLNGTQIQTVQVEGVDKQVLTVQIPAGSSSAKFRMKATSTSTVGEETLVYMSSVLGSVYSAAGALQASTVSRTVRIGQDSPPGVSIRLDGATTCSVVADSDYTVYKAKLQVRIENDRSDRTSSVAVDLTAAAGGDDKELYDLAHIYSQKYLRITKGEGFPSIDGDEGKTSQVTIPVGESSVDCYVYVLGAKDTTEENGIRFAPAKPSGAVWPEGMALADVPAATLYVRRLGDSGIAVAKTSPSSTVESPATISMAKKEKKSFTVWFNDTYRNMFVSKTYTFRLVGTGDHEGETFAEITGSGYKTGNPNGYYQFSLTLADDVKENKTYSCELYGESADGSTTEHIPYVLNVIDGKSTYIKQVGETLTFGEGETIQVKLGLNQEGDDGKYIFIKGATAADDLLFDSNQKTQGAPLGDDKTTVAGTKMVKLLDGNEGGREVNLRAILSDSIDEIVETYGWNKGALAVVVTNKPPVLKSLSIAGQPLQVSGDNNTVLGDTVPMGVEKEFRIVSIDEVVADRTNLVVRWVIDGVQYDTTNDVSQSFANCCVKHAFTAKTAEGKKGQLVQVWLKDKDMLDFAAEPNFTCWVKVAPKPYVSISSSGSGGQMSETDGGVAILTVALSEAATEAIDVKLMIKKTTGVFKLHETEGSVTYVGEESGYDVYNLSYKTGVEKTILIDELDGTADSILDMTAAVTTPGWTTYYDAATLSPPLRVNNVAPQINRPTSAEEAYTNVNASANTPYSIYYGASDVKADLAAGIDVEIRVDGKTVHTDKLYSGTEVKDVKVQFDGAGAHVVEYTFTDKDHLSSRATVNYYVSQSKVLQLRAHGPAIALSSSGGYSVKYQGASGLGAGRVYAGENGPQKVASFVHTYSFGLLESSVTAYAFGYTADQTLVDNGTLSPGPDQPIDKNGNWTNGETITDYYNYALDDYTVDTRHKGAKGLDSFVYGWACDNSESSKSSDSGTEEFMLGFGKSGSISIPLPDSEDSSSSSSSSSSQLKSIPIQYWEAIFSAELLKSDNCGDINGDGIPDLYVQLYKFDVIDTSNKLVGDDLRDLNYTSGEDGSSTPYCAEGDYLPTIERAEYASLIPGLPETWATIGNEFTPVLKIRGFPEADLANDSVSRPSALNNAPELAGLSQIEPKLVYTDPRTDEDSTLSYVEWLAWSEFKAANPTKTEKDWSPERPTDPTKSDTDLDGITDGYEYWVWYRAHVGWVENYGTAREVHKRLTGRRYDPRNPGEGTRISSDEIAKAFDPRSSAGSSTRDTDNDGLPDILEFTLGTSPYDFDTDGDGLPDGWEIMIAGYDPTTSQSSADAVADTVRNYDGDAMAVSSYVLEQTQTPVAREIEHAKRWTFAVERAGGDTDGVQWYATTEDPTAFLEEGTAVAAGWYLVSVDGVDYCVEEKPVVVDGRLAVDTKAYSIAAFTAPAPEPEPEEDGATVPDDGVSADAGDPARGYPVTLPAGTVLDGPEEEQTEPLKVWKIKDGGIDEANANACWIYGKGSANALAGEVADSAADYGCLALARNLAVDAGAVVTVFPKDDRDVAFLHYLCYQEFGFDPRTAWNPNTPLHKRWSRTIDGEAISDTYLLQQGGYAGYATRTRAFAAYDEFLLCSFFINNLTDGVKGGTVGYVTTVIDTTAPEWAKVWSALTTNPQGPGEPDLIAGDDYWGRSSDQGADTDLDGVPDGWELYIMSGPKDEKNGVFVFAPPYDGFLASCGTKEMAKSYFSPFVAESSNNETASPLVTGTTSENTNYALTELRKYAGTDSCGYYSDIASDATVAYSTTIVRPDADANWLNKFFPCDPWSADTDNDGVTDGTEGHTGATGFIYGTPFDDGSLTSIPGGGLNPLATDTDRDGLPDAWELQFKGHNDSLYAGDDADYAEDDDGNAQGNALQGLTDGMDGTVADAHNYPLDETGTGVKFTIVNGVSQVVDRDYDHDGLDNWQEYLTGTMRCWRYDDPVTPLNGIPASTYYKADDEGKLVFDAKKAAKDLGFGDDDEAVGKFWYKTLVDGSSPLFNPHFVTDTCAGSQYFSRIENVWDLAYLDDNLSQGASSGAYYWFCNRIGDQMLGNLWAARWKEALEADYDSVPARYASCSPIDPDSDHDGMDDSYELFHGMNPLLGGNGVVADWNIINGGGAKHDGDPVDLVHDSLSSMSGLNPQAWGEGDTKTSYMNFWQRLWAKRKASSESEDDDKYVGPLPRGTGYDFVFYPWLNGLATADADGDGTRNQEEAVMPLVSPTTAWHHTDPTALWMTDSSYSNSLVRTSYRLPIRSESIAVEGDGFTYDGKTYLFSQFDGFVEGEFIAFNPDRWGIGSSQDDMNYIASFEENEGYDTDHDGIADNDELGGKYRGKTDPLDADSPRRRQAMYFQGAAKPSVLQTMPFVNEMHPDAFKNNRYPDDMSFLQFTVECWVKPESLDDATILERVMWTSESNPADREFVRCNFRLAVKEGKWAAKFDPNDTTKKSVEALSTLEASTDWTHLAATYDGDTLRLYVNGVQRGFRQSGLQPAYGSAAVSVDGLAGWHAEPTMSYWRNNGFQLHAIVMGASVKTCLEGATDGRALDVTRGAGFGAYAHFFKGYLDEVRIWDGARSASEIAADKGVRYTAEMAAANRDEFYEEWSKTPAVGLYRGRYAKDGSGNPYVLPAELRFHWSFDSVFGAGSETMVAKVPAGFDFPGEDDSQTGARGRLTRPDGYEISWWKKVLDGYGSVYAGVTNWVTWIPNTVTHLPRFDGTTLDSRYWSEDYAGDAAGTYRFARTAEPVSLWTQYALKDAGGYTTTGSRNFFLTSYDYNNGTTFGKLYEFTGRHLNQSGDDLLPLGHAYVKHIDEMWDEQGPSSNWEVTGSTNAGTIDGDKDGDGLPNWWEEYADEVYRDASTTERGKIEWETVVLWPGQNGVRITAGEAFLRDLARGYHPDADGILVDDGSDGDYAQSSDLDGNGIPDWWEELYGLSGVEALEDTDNDGLPNYVEYLLSEVFDFNVMFSPIDARSVDPYTLDYFYKVGDLYVGEIFTDHDLVDDAWEDLYPNAFSSRLLWDAYKDNDSDGWSNRAEVRYAKQSMPTEADKQTHYSAADGLVADYPIPTIELTLNYNEALAETVRMAPIVVEMRRNDSAVSSPDASFVIGEVEDARAGTGESSDKTTDRTTTSYTRTLGKWSNRHAIGTLTPGYINKDSLALQFCFDPDAVTYTWELSYDQGSGYEIKRGTRAEYDSDLRKYGENNVSLVSRDTSYAELSDVELRTVEGTSKAVWSLSKANIDFGTVDLTTGAFDINMGAFAGQFVSSSTNGTSSVSNQTDLVSMEDQTYRIVYTVNPAVDLPRKLYLGEADSGYVKEGLNQIVAFFDLNGDGAYSAGEPYGIANDVDISWKGNAATIEVNEVSPVTPRITLWSGSSNGSSGSSGSSGGSGSSSAKTADRSRTVSDVYQEIKDEIAALRLSDKAYANEMASLNWMESNLIEETTPAANENIRLRVVRWLVDGKPVWRLNVSPTVVLDKQITYRAGTALTEADFLTDGELDLDWSNLYTEVVTKTGVIDERLPVKRVDYLVVIGDGETYWKNASETNVIVKALSQVITRYYGASRTTPVAVEPSITAGQVVRAANPTFSWTVDEPQLTGYTAFKIVVSDTSGVVYDSGLQPAPARDADGRYSWAAPLYVGDKTANGRVYANDANYTWKVAMYNAKYPTDVFSAPATYLQATQTNGLEYGTARVAVKYYGPKETFAKATVRVRAFTSPDFTGTPVAAGYVALPDDAESGLEVAGRDPVENCQVVGLPKGDFYLQAFIDSNTNGVWDSWESMGYLCDRSGASAEWLNPVAITFGDTVGKSDLAVIYIEDADTDGDSLPDAWEVAKYGSLTAKGVESATLTPAGEYVTEKTLAAQLKTKGEAAGGVAGEILTTLNSSKAMMALVSGVAPETLDPEVSITITGLAFNSEANAVEITFGGEVSSMGASLDNAVYAYKPGDSLTFQVYHTETLAGEWQPLGEAKTVTVSSGNVGETLSVALEGLDVKGGFFKVVVK